MLFFVSTLSQDFLRAGPAKYVLTKKALSRTSHWKQFHVHGSVLLTAPEPVNQADQSSSRPTDRETGGSGKFQSGLNQTHSTVSSLKNGPLRYRNLPISLKKSNRQSDIYIYISVASPHSARFRQSAGVMRRIGAFFGSSVLWI